MKYNNITINKMYHNKIPILKAYKDGVIVFGGDWGGSSTNYPKFAVVNDISDYHETDYDWVYDLAGNKWYVLNSSTQYEQYGVVVHVDSLVGVTTYEGKYAVCDGYEYEFTNGSWVNVGEVTGTTVNLPPNSYQFNYNAKDYDSSTHTIVRTDTAHQGQPTQDFLNDLTLSKAVDGVGDGYLTFNSNSHNACSFSFGGTSNNPFNRNSNNKALTLIYKAKFVNYTILGNRGSGYNWMARYNMFHTSVSGFLGFTPTDYQTQPRTIVITVEDDGTATRKCIETEQEETGSISYGGLSDKINFFYDGYGSEYFGGDFYWMYFADYAMDDSEIADVINYNNGSSTEILPEEPVEKSAPEQDKTFATIAERDAYEWFYVGFKCYVTSEDKNYEYTSNFEYEEIVTPVESRVTLTSDTNRGIPMQTFRIDATDPGTTVRYFITFSKTANASGNYQNVTSFSICPDEGTIWDNGTSKRITDQTHIEGNIYEYTFSSVVYFGGAETNAPLSQVQYLDENA